MNAAQLLEHFDRISDATDAVPRLRRFVLDLAVRGKLSVAQKTRNTKMPAYVAHPSQREHEHAVPFEIPIDWVWTPLNQIGRLSGGMTPAMARADFWNGGIVWLSPKDIKADEVFSSELTITYQAVSETKLTLYPPGSLFIVARSGILKRTLPVAINRVAAAANQDMKVLVPSDTEASRFIQIMLRGMTPFVLANLVKTGTTVQSLKYREFETQLFPLPPLAEQQRIVAKVDELMALCDRLEAAQVEREARRDRLVSASLARVTRPAADDAASDARAAGFHLDHFARLTTRPEHVKQLRQTILNLAVRGRLVPGPDKNSPTALSEVATLQNGYAFKSQWFSKTGVRLLRNANVSHGVLRWDDCVCLSDKQADEYRRFQLTEGDIVVSLDRPFISTGTKVAWVRANDLPSLLLQRVGRFCIDTKRLLPKYLFLWLTSPDFETQMTPGRSLGVPHIASKEVEAALIRVPPLAEQRRIVAKVDELMTLCDQLEASLAAAATDRARLLESLLHEALAPAA